MHWRSVSTVAAARGLRFVAGASPRQFLSAAILQVIGALSSVFLVYAAKLVLDSLVRSASGTVLSATDIVLPLSVLAVATALNGAVSSVQSQQLRLLAEDVENHTWREVLSVTGRVELRQIESPSFAERSERLQSNSLNRPYAIANATLTLLGSVVTVVTLVAAVLAIEPLLVPVLLLAGLPSVILSRKAAATELSFTKRWSLTYRERQYYRSLLSQQSFAK
jgi:ATP-binding cassette subfamily B protein